MNPLTDIVMDEWQTLSADECPLLAGRDLDNSHCRALLERLSASRQVRFTELRRGLQIQSFSHVGRLQLGDFSLTIRPKLKGSSLLSLLRYAYGFRRLKLFAESEQAVEQLGFADLLIHQLNDEIEELISRGLLRSYIPVRERLSSPRGRLDINRLAKDGNLLTATLPCQHHPRIEDTLLNQTLLAGLQLAATTAGSIELRRRSRRLASSMEEQVSIVRLDGVLMDRAALQMTRLTAIYEPALSIIRLLLEAQGVALEGGPTASKLPGFLFDMNSFFQALMSRFLHDHLPDFVIRDEHGLTGMLNYNPHFNPQRRRAPTPRPDYVVTQRGGAVCSILDAKYRDLWEQQLPREMLYQMVVYAISESRSHESCILYATSHPGAREARIDITDPLYGRHLGQVALRPVYLPRIVELLASDTAHARRERTNLAQQLAFGTASRSLER